MAKVNINQTNATRLARVHFAYVAVYALFIIGADTWNLVTRDLSSQRWLVCGALLIITSIVWYLSRAPGRSNTFYRVLVILLVLADIGIASFAVWTERGMASRGVALYALPIVSSAVLLSRTAIFTTAALCTATYAMTATRYFFVNFNEGYKVELYTTVGLYAAGFFLMAAILWIVVSSVSPGNSGGTKLLAKKR